MVSSFKGYGENEFLNRKWLTMLRYTQIDVFFLVLLGAWLSTIGIGFPSICNNNAILVVRTSLSLATIFYFLWSTFYKKKSSKTTILSTLSTGLFPSDEQCLREKIQLQAPKNHNSVLY